jgi:hypothetical protein
MNAIYQTRTLPDVTSVPSEVTMTDKWDSAAISNLIRSKSDFCETPAFLFLGEKETELLRGHLAAAFGSESVPTLYDTYYMGLEVITIDCKSFVFAGGRKRSKNVSAAVSPRPEWRDRVTEELRQLRI